jgi:hypothetical protein
MIRAVKHVSCLVLLLSLSQIFKERLIQRPDINDRAFPRKVIIHV